tara:strand:- start:356 stop:580 length:225 start_codon:yes stop_codon:yes gene_type:complete
MISLIQLKKISGKSLLFEFKTWMQNTDMIPEIFQLTEQSRQISLWWPVLGVIILFLGMNVQIEFKIQREEDEKN